MAPAAGGFWASGPHYPPPTQTFPGGPPGCGAAHLWRGPRLPLRSRSPSLAFKRALKRRPTQSRERGRGLRRACAPGGGRRGWAVEGGEGRSRGIGREALPGSRREGRIGLHSAPPGGAVCLQPPPPALAAPSSSRPRRRAGRCSQPERRRAGRAAGPAGRVGSRGRRASSLLFAAPGPLSPRPRGAGPRESRTERKPAPGVRRPGRGRQRGAMSYQGKKSIPHITVSQAPAAGPPSFVGRGGVAARVQIRRGTQGRPGRLSAASRRVGRGRSRLCRPLPPASGDNVGEGSPAWRGGAGAAGPSPRGLAAPSPHGMCQRMAWTRRMRS